MGVRRERVVLELEDGLSTGMAKAAAATALLDRNLDHLSGSTVKTERATRGASSEIDAMTRTSVKADSSINQLTGRIRLLADAGAALGPSLLPIGAVAVPAIAGLASGLGFAAIGAGTAVLAFQGIGDTLKAVNKAALEPTTANLEAAQQAMAKLSPEAQGFVEQLRAMAPELERLRDAAAAGLLPGLADGLDGLLQAGPRVERIITAISTELGSIASDAGQSLGGERWADFLDFVADEGPAALSSFAQAAGNTTHALAELWMATDPLNDDFSDWLVRVTADFDKWAAGLSQTDGFQEFIDYIEANGPQVADTLGAVGSAVLQIVEAVAPLGGPSLKIIESFANALATIADSPLGTPLFGLAAALGAANTALRVMGSLNAKTFGGPAVANLRGYSAGLNTVITAQQRATMSAEQLAAAEATRSRGLAGLGKSAALLGGLAIASTGASDSLGLTNTVSLGLAGSMAGPFGAAIGGTAGLFLDAKSSADAFSDSLEDVGAIAASGDLDAIREKLAGIKGELHDMSSTDGTGDWFSDGLDTFKDSLSNVFHPWDAGQDDAKGRGAVVMLELAAAVAEATKQTKEHEAAVAKDDAAMQALTVAASETANQFLNFGHNADNAKVSLHDWITEMNQQASALQNFAKNARVAAEKGLSQGAIDKLMELGPQGALMLKRLANDGGKEIDRLNRAFGRGQVGVEQLRQVLEDFEVAKKNAARPVTLRVNTTYAVSAVTALKNLMDSLHSKTVNITVNKNTNATSAEREANDNDGPKWSGGWTGPGGKYEPKGVVHGNEVVLPTEVVKRDGPMLKARYGYLPGMSKLPGYDSGGLVDDTPDSVLSGLYGSGGGNGPTSNRTTAAKNREAAAANSAARALASLKIIVDRSSASIDKERAERDELRSMKADLSSSVAGSFRSDLFGGGGNVWAGDADRTAGVLGTLRGDISNANQFKEVLKVLKSKGLSGEAFAEVARSGDLEAARNLAQSGDVQTFENLFNLRRTATNATGNLAGDAAFGAQLAVQQRQLIVAVAHGKELAKLVRLAEANPAKAGYYLGKYLNGAAASAKRKAN